MVLSSAGIAVSPDMVTEKRAGGASQVRDGERGGRGYEDEEEMPMVTECSVMALPVEEPKLRHSESRAGALTEAVNDQIFPLSRSHLFLTF